MREKIWKNVKNRWQITGILPVFTTCLRIHLSHFSEFFANFSTRGQFLPIFTNFCRFWEILENSEKSQNAKFTLFTKIACFLRYFRLSSVFITCKKWKKVKKTWKFRKISKNLKILGNPKCPKMTHGAHRVSRRIFPLNFNEYVPFGVCAQAVKFEEKPGQNHPNFGGKSGGNFEKTAVFWRRFPWMRAILTLKKVKNWSFYKLPVDPKIRVVQKCGNFGKFSGAQTVIPC